MSARSRYLAAISPNERVNAVVSLTEPRSNRNGPKLDLPSPTAVASRQPKSFNESKINNNPAPPPPPPGPPPPKKSGRRSTSLGKSSRTADDNVEVKETVSFRGSRSSTSLNSQKSDEMDRYKVGGSQSFNSQSSKVERTPSAPSNPLSPPSSFGRNSSHLSASSGPDSPAKSTASGEVWSPKDEIKPGNVAKFRNMLWGGESSSPREGGTALKPREQGQKLNRGGNKKTFKEEKEEEEGGSADNEGTTQRYQKQSPGPNNIQPNAPNTQRAPPSTPPRPSASRNYNNYNSPNRGRISTRSPSPPKYKLNAPPSLKIGGRDKVAPPTRMLKQRPEKSPVKVRNGGSDSVNSNNSSPLRERASGLNLAPIDTSFGVGGSGKSRNRSDINTDGSSVTSLPPSGSNSRSKSNDARAETLTLLGASPSPADTDGNNKFPFALEEEDKYALSPETAPTVSSSVANASVEAAPPTPMINPPGVITITAFKRPDVKVGMVFSRRSRSSPDVCVISRIIPDSIFSSHEHRFAREESGGTLKGAEVIAVNGIPVREPRHAAELVAGCANEVMLTIKRVSNFNSQNRSTNTESINEELDPTSELAPISQGEPVHKMNEGPNKTDDDELIIPEEKNKDGCDDIQLEQSQNLSDKQRSTKSQDIIQRRRQIAQAMITSSEMVEDHVPSHKADSQQDDEVKQSSLNYGASSIQQRRLAALQMYQSQEMVADNVDDARLGTIDTNIPSKAFDPISSFTCNNDPFGDNVSVATTNVTTSSDATQRMGSNNIKEFFGDTFPQTNDIPLKSPQAQRRKERAIQRIANSSSVSRSAKAPPSAVSTSATSPTALRSPVSNDNKILSNLPAQPASQTRVIKPDDESVAAASTAASSVAASAATSTAAVSESSGESRGSRSLFGKKKKQSTGSLLAETAPVKRKSSIFGVANLIRKVNSRKSKSSKKGQRMQDSSIFDDRDESDQNNQRSIPPIPENKPTSSANATAITEAPAPQSKEIIPKEPIPEPSTWGNNEFFEDAFASSPFDASSSVNDAFGFPAQLSTTQENSSFFDESLDAWGEPSSLKSSVKHVDFTPRRNNTSNFPNSALANDDVMSYDASEMSEVTNPTYQSRPDPDTETKKSHIIQSSHGLDSLDKAEGDMTADGSESQKENNNPANDDPPLTGLEDSSDEEGDAFDLLEDSQQSTSTHAKSRIMERYSKGGRLRKPVRNDNRVNPPPPPPPPPSTSKSQMIATRDAPSASRSRSIQPEIAPCTVQPAQRVSPQKQGLEGNDSTTVENASARRNERIQQTIRLQQGLLAKDLSFTNTASARRSERIQRTNRLQQEKRETASDRQSNVPSTPTSLVYRRKNGRMATDAGLDKSLDNSFSSETKRKKDPFKKKSTPSMVDDPNYFNMEEKLLKIKDPIQRAGVRLLWAAAIPIQTQSRRFLARQIAIQRMCGILTIQAFVRRWLAERDLEIAIWSVIQIQAVFRGWYARDSLEDNHYCAVQIQRIVRGYLATMHVFEDLYSITVAQSVVRMHLAINRAVDRLSSVIAIQAWYRGVSTLIEVGEKEYSAVAIQSNWRRYLCQMSYQFDIIDIIIVQSIIRRRNAIKERNSLYAVKIQSAWRSYDYSMAYVHTLADIITAQSVARRWYSVRYQAAVRLQCIMRVILAKKHFSEQNALHSLVTRHVSATKIQSWCRSYYAQVQMLIDIVNIIVVQSLWRRRGVLRLYGPLLNRIKLARERTTAKAAIKIQSAWRSFIVYSSYLILQYENQAATTVQSYWRRYYQYTNYSIIYFEIVKIQAAVRGYQQRIWMDFEDDCATIIQAATRRYLERKDINNDTMIEMLIAAASNSLRMKNAAKKIQRLYLDDLWSRREKEAALTIERFFIFVKREVEAEVIALKKKKKMKRKLRKMKQSDEWILERAWLNTVEEPTSFAQGEAPSTRQQDQRPSMYNMSERFIQSGEEIQSDVSALTNNPGMRNISHKLMKNQVDIEDARREDAFHASESRYAKKQQDVYLRSHGYSQRQRKASM